MNYKTFWDAAFTDIPVFEGLFVTAMVRDSDDVIGSSVLLMLSFIVGLSTLTYWDRQNIFATLETKLSTIIQPIW